MRERWRGEYSMPSATMRAGEIMRHNVVFIPEPISPMRAGEIVSGFCANGAKTLQPHARMGVIS